MILVQAKFGLERGQPRKGVLAPVEQRGRSRLASAAMRAEVCSPAAPGDLLWQIVLFCGAYWLYRLVRGQVFDQSAAAFEHARDIVSPRRRCTCSSSRRCRTGRSARWIDDVGSWMYLNTHFVVTTCTLAFIYLFRNEHFYFVRNMFMVAMGLALVGYVLYPTAPPRMLPELGLRRLGLGLHRRLLGRLRERALQPLRRGPVDARRLRADAGGADDPDGQAALGEGAVGGLRARRHAVVVVTANHWVLDAVAGAAVAAVSALAAQTVFARVRPQAWAWAPEEDALPAPARAG